LNELLDFSSNSSTAYVQWQLKLIRTDSLSQSVSRPHSVLFSVYDKLGFKRSVLQSPTRANTWKLFLSESSACIGQSQQMLLWLGTRVACVLFLSVENHCFKQVAKNHYLGCHSNCKHFLFLLLIVAFSLLHHKTKKHTSIEIGQQVNAQIFSRGRNTLHRIKPQRILMKNTTSVLDLVLQSTIDFNIRRE